MLTGAEIDQVAGLLSMREREPFTICATATTLAALAGNTLFDALAPDLVTRRALVPGETVALPGGLQAELFIVPGKVPLYLEGENPETASETAANVGVEISAGDARILFIPGAAAVTPAMRERMARADVVFFDGTLYRDDEMLASGTGVKTGRRMGHMPIDGDDGTLAALADDPGAPHLPAHQQHQSDPDRRLARTRRRRAHGLGGRRGRNGNRALISIKSICEKIQREVAPPLPRVTAVKGKLRHPPPKRAK